MITVKESEVHTMDKKIKTIGDLKEMPKGDGYAELPTVGELEGMLGGEW